ncbi:hypothetical protein AB1Y20_010280 [Prymnesium parvum]|uniref:Methyltransferase domain-containing protein n=1 Tax=Prymnesium parvum TaxID=97485 RepID=A0AB34K6Z2_PRYPA
MLLALLAFPSPPLPSRLPLSPHARATPLACAPPTPPPPAADPVDRFLDSAAESLRTGSFVKLTLSSNANARDEAAAHLLHLRRVHARLVALKRGLHVQLTLQYDHRHAVRNVPPDALRAALRDYVGVSACRSARLFCTDGDLELAISRRGAARLLAQKPALVTAKGSAAAPHDRTKARLTPAAASYLVALGVTDEAGKPRPGMAGKRRQIERFVQTIAALVGSPPPDSAAAERTLHVCDVGCGRGYLTFATHAYLAAAGWGVRTLGVELRPALVAEVEAIARRLGGEFAGLHFAEGAIARVLPDGGEGGGGRGEGGGGEGGGGERVDVLIALHACDTATDDALWCGIARGARVVVTAPCCHKQARRRWRSGSRRGGGGGWCGEDGWTEAWRGGRSGVVGERSSATCLAPTQVRQQLDPFLAAAEGEAHPLEPLLKHAIFRERTAEMVTDAVRSLLLQLAGYDVKVFEFVGGEHTSKNVMIAATRRVEPHTESERAGIRLHLQQQLSMFGIRRQRLAERMGELPY